MKGDLSIKLLEILELTTSTTIDLLDVFLCGYSGSYKKARRLMNNSCYSTPLADSLREKQKFYNLIYRLQQDGLVKKSKDKNTTSAASSKRFWHITKKGKEKLKILKEQQQRALPPKNYKIQKRNDGLKIVTFDIPEKYKRKRDWLRSVLVGLEFSMLQKSVWIGKNKLPEDLIHDLKKINILSYIEILSINKSGTIKKL